MFPGDMRVLSRGRSVLVAGVAILMVACGHGTEVGLIRADLDPVVLGALVANAFNGALLRWSYGA